MAVEAIMALVSDILILISCAMWIWLGAKEIRRTTRRGQWRKRQDGRYECSICKSDFGFSHHTTQYCPNCGKRMKPEYSEYDVEKMF